MIDGGSEAAALFEAVGLSKLKPDGDTSGISLPGNAAYRALSVELFARAWNVGTSEKMALLSFVVTSCFKTGALVALAGESFGAVTDFTWLDAVVANIARKNKATRVMFFMVFSGFSRDFFASPKQHFRY